jgi:hypothetical protein
VEGVEEGEGKEEGKEGAMQWVVVYVRRGIYHLTFFPSPPLFSLFYLCFSLFTGRVFCGRK